MNLFRESFLLFSLNLLDALLTIIWIRNGVATEGNFLLAPLLEIGDLTFLGVKLAIGTFTAFVFLRFGGESRIAGIAADVDCHAQRIVRQVPDELQALLADDTYLPRPSRDRRHARAELAVELQRRREYCK